MKSLSLMLALAPLALSAETVPIRWQLQTDGTQVYPLNVLATTSEVTAAQTTAASLSATATTQAETLATLQTELTTLQEQLADVTSDGVWTLSLFCEAVGFAAKASDGTSRVEWTSVPTPSSTTGTFQTDVELTLANLTLIVSATLDEMTAGNTPTAVEVTSTGTSTFDDGTTSYTYSVDCSALTFGEASFYKLVYDDMITLGTGNYLPVVGGMNVDGVNGRTVTVSATDADTGEAVTLSFIGGILVEPEAVASEE